MVISDICESKCLVPGFWSNQLFSFSENAEVSCMTGGNEAVWHDPQIAGHSRRNSSVVASVLCLRAFTDKAS